MNAPGPDGRTVPLWARWLGKPRPGGKDIDMFSTNDPEWGILGTPVISDDRKMRLSHGMYAPVTAPKRSPAT
jgi:hypothetical protein